MVRSKPHLAVRTRASVRLRGTWGKEGGGSVAFCLPFVLLLNSHSKASGY